MLSAQPNLTTVSTPTPGDAQKPAVIVCPGGGYGMHADHEAEPVAEWLESIGVRAFDLRYRLAPHLHPDPVNDAFAAIRYVRENAETLGVNPDQIGILGFSAGGHLAGTACVRHDLAPTDPISARPDFGILIYPVVTMQAHTRGGSKTNLLGENPDSDLVDALSLELQVNAATPPLFLVHGANDGPVPVENSLALASALARKNIPFELHVIEDGPHGFGLGQPNQPTNWPPACEHWLVRRASGTP
jgi:acetyl esterase/lipase